MTIRKLIALAVATSAIASAPAHATPETVTSPTGGALPAGVTQVGGLVVDLKGVNGTRVVSQLAASQMYRGFANSSDNNVPGVAEGNPLLFGTQSGFSPAILGALGGGLASASFRITLADGDTAPGDFDFNDNTFSANNVLIGNWSSVTTYNTNSSGTIIQSQGTGFGNNILSTGFFSLSDTAALATFYASLSTGSIAFTLNDVDPNDNYYDFTQGVDGGLINVGQGPVIAPPTGPVPEPATWLMLILGFGAVGATLRRRQQTAHVSFA